MEARTKAARAEYRGLLWGGGWRVSSGPALFFPHPMEGAPGRSRPPNTKGLTEAETGGGGTQASPPPCPGEEACGGSARPPPNPADWRVGDGAPAGHGEPCMAAWADANGRGQAKFGEEQGSIRAAGCVGE